jgi:adenylate kinase family enzyme
MSANRHEALLLLGPTGSGKTPLGQVLAERGINTRPCAHFDFGDNLRTVAARSEEDADFSVDDIVFLRRVLETGALLEDKDFPIAERILKSFLTTSAQTASTMIILNGLPRHVGQASALEPLLDVQTVVQLHCTPRTVYERIASNTGGDRAERVDDQLHDIERKLEIFAQRTFPLVQHYQQQGARLVPINVTKDMTAESMRQLLVRSILP